MKRAVAAALAAASLQVSSANLTYRTCKLTSGVSVLHDGACEELARLQQVKRDEERAAAAQKEAEEKRAVELAEQARAWQIDKERRESHQALKECMRLARCRLHQLKYHLARMHRNDFDVLLGEPVLSHSARKSTYNYYRVSADGRRVVLQLEVIGASIANINVLW